MTQPIEPPPQPKPIYLDNGVWRIGDYALDAAGKVWQLAENTEADNGGNTIVWQGFHHAVYLTNWFENPARRGPVKPIKKMQLIPVSDDPFGQFGPAWPAAISFTQAMHWAIEMYKNETVPGRIPETIIAAALEIMAAAEKAAVISTP